jgi:hypothetical protein
MFPEELQILTRFLSPCQTSSGGPQTFTVDWVTRRRGLEHLRNCTERQEEAFFSIVTGVESRQEQIVDSSLFHRLQTGSGTHPASYPMGTPRVKPPAHEADRSTLSSTEVKECMELYLHSPICLHSVVLS